MLSLLLHAIKILAVTHVCGPFPKATERRRVRKGSRVGGEGGRRRTRLGHVATVSWTASSALASPLRRAWSNHRPPIPTLHEQGTKGAKARWKRGREEAPNRRVEKRDTDRSGFRPVSPDARAHCPPSSCRRRALMKESSLSGRRIFQTRRLSASSLMVRMRCRLRASRVSGSARRAGAPRAFLAGVGRSSSSSDGSSANSGRSPRKRPERRVGASPRARLLCESGPRWAVSSPPSAAGARGREGAGALRPRHLSRSAFFRIRSSRAAS